MSVNQTTKRLTDILFDHWNQVRGNRMFPSKQDINEFELKNLNIWADSFLIEVYPLIQTNGYRFLHKGANLSDDFTKDSSGKYIKNIVTGFLDAGNNKYDIVAEQKRPLQEDEVYKSPVTGAVIKYRQILLPLGPDDDGEIDAILGGMRFIKE